MNHAKAPKARHKINRSRPLASRQIQANVNPMASFKALLAASLVRNSRKEKPQEWEQSIALAAQSEDNFEREVEVRTRAICEHDFCASFTSLVESEVHSALLAHVTVIKADESDIRAELESRLGKGAWEDMMECMNDA